MRFQKRSTKMTVNANKAKEKRDTHIRRHAEAAIGFGVGSTDHHRMDRSEQADGKEGDRCAESPMSA